VVGTFHAAGEGRSALYGIARVLYKKVHARLDHLIAVSEPARELASRYFPGDYEIIPNGIDISRFSPRAGKPHDFPSSEGPTVLFVGRNEPRKGLAVLLEAFPVVAREVPGCTLVIAGSGFEQEKVRRSLPPDVRDQAVAVGFVSNEDLPAFYSSADVFCAPALGGESFGIILIEAIACGTPVVASHIPGYKAVVEDTGGGRVFNTGDAMSLAQVLREVLLDDAKRAELADAGLERVKRYSWERLAERLEEVYSGR
jgi:phosphatidylinositol alpha-mannosyltransferase